MKHFSLKPVFATNYLEDGFLPYTFGHVYIFYLDFEYLDFETLPKFWTLFEDPP